EAGGGVLGVDHHELQPQPPAQTRQMLRQPLPPRPTNHIPEKSQTHAKKLFPCLTDYSALVVDQHTFVANARARRSQRAPQAQLSITAEDAEEPQGSQRGCERLRVLCAFSASSAVILWSAYGALRRQQDERIPRLAPGWTDIGRVAAPRGPWRAFQSP